MITPRQAELLSYLQGLAPVGEWVEPQAKHIRQDINCNTRVQLCLLRQALVEKGTIEVKRIGYKNEGYAYRVIKRVEECEIGCKPSGRPREWDWDKVYRRKAA